MPVDDQDPPDALHRFGTELAADLREHCLASLSRQRRQLELDQLVAGKRPVDFSIHRRAEPGVADDDQRVQAVGGGAQGAALPGFERHGGTGIK